MRPAFLLLLFFVFPAFAAPLDFKKDVPWEELSDHDISDDWGQRTLKEINAGNWKHAETEHFIIHYDRDASRIARRAEEIYATIFEFFGNPPDRMAGKKSHIFVIDSWESFQVFSNTISEMPWSGGVTRGNEFYFPGRDRDGDFDTKGMTLNHEMTHLVFNRMYPDSNIPTWLNEGIAQYFGMRENMGTKEFRRNIAMYGSMDLEEFFKFNYHESNPAESTIRSFYGEASMLVDYLTEKQPKEKLLVLVERSLKGGDSEAMIIEVYGYKDQEDFRKDYQKYHRKFE